MAGVFDGKTKIGRAVADPKTDQKLPSLGSLSQNKMTDKMGLSGTVGTACILVHGDRWVRISATQNMEVVGDQFTNITGNETHTVLHTRTENITQNNSLTVGGNQDWTIAGSHMALHTGPKTETLVSPLNMVESAPWFHQEPTQKIHILGVEFEKKDEEFTYTTNSFEIHTIANEINLVFKNEATTLNNEVKLIDYATVLGVSIEPKISEVHLEPLHTFLEGAHAGAGGGKATAEAGVGVPPNVPTGGSK